MDKYILFLDESETCVPKGQDRFFAVGGVIININSIHAISSDLCALKSSLWPGDSSAHSHILHEKEISDAIHGRDVKKIPSNMIFKANRNVKKLYAGLSRILKKHDITTLCVCLDLGSLAKLYPGETNSKLTIALQMLLENYCHFLQSKNAVGDICYESLQEPGNKELRQRFYELEALGTMYYTAHFIQTHIGDISFVGKNENKAGLQLADFIPNTFARYCCNLQSKHCGFKKTVMKQAYGGDREAKKKYGLKRIPSPT